jgi:hypothetical protein
VSRPTVRARFAAVLVLVGAVLGSTLGSTSPAAAAPVSRVPGKAIELLTPYQSQSTCNPAPKVGTLALSKLVLAAYPGTGSSGIARDCSVGGRSEHKEGRAWDWTLSYADPKQRAMAADFARWLFAPDAYGNTYAQARRLGVMYVIWNHKIWSAYAAGSGWRPYTGADPHTGHMHISLSWAGALKKTSYWTGTVSPVLKAPAPGQAPVAPAHPAPPLPQFPQLPDAPRHDHDGRPVDNPPVDTRPVLVDGERSLDVLSTNEGVTSTFAVKAGRHYLLTTTGMYAYGVHPMSADAECTVWPKDTYWHRSSQWEGRTSSGAYDLTVDGRWASWTPLVDDGNDCDTTTHTYTMVIQARRDGPLQLSIADPKRADNGGGLRVVVRALDTRSPTD